MQEIATSNAGLETPLAKPLRFGVVLGLMMLVVAVFGSWKAIVQHLAFQSSAYDLGLYEQAVYHLARFERPEVTIHRSANILTDHFSPMWIVYAPFQRLGGTYGMLALQPALLALAAFPIANFARRRLSARGALAVAGVYLLSPGLWAGIGFDVHELSMAAPLAIWTIDLYDRRRLLPAGLAALAWLLTKEDQGLTIAALGMIAFFRRDRILGATFLIVGGAWPFVVMKIINPLLGGSGYQYWLYGQFAPTPSGLIAWALRHPRAFLAQFVIPPIKIQTFIATVTPLGLLGLVSPYAWLLVPIFAARYLGIRPAFWRVEFQYGMVPSAIAAVCAADGIARLRARWPQASGRVALALTGTAVLISLAYLVGPGKLGLLRTLPGGATFATAERLAPVRRAIASIPSDASVGGDNFTVPQFAARKEAYVFFISADIPPTEYLVLSGENKQVIGWWLRDNPGYREIFSQGDYRILRRTFPATDYVKRRTRTMAGFPPYLKGHLLERELPMYPGYGEQDPTRAR